MLECCETEEGDAGELSNHGSASGISLHQGTVQVPGTCHLDDWPMLSPAIAMLNYDPA